MSYIIKKEGLLKIQGMLKRKYVVSYQSFINSSNIRKTKEEGKITQIIFSKGNS
jgi:hypothetical protein